jgi:hypothetical protein
MRLAEGALLHQVHLVKLGADASASLISGALLWNSRPGTAIAVRLLVPGAASAAVLGLADLDSLARTRRGRYVLVHMPASAQAVRLAGDAVMALGAYRRSPVAIIAGAVVVGIGWSHARWPGSRRDRQLLSAGFAGRLSDGHVRSRRAHRGG